MDVEPARSKAGGRVSLVASGDRLRLTLGGEIDAANIGELNDAVGTALGHGTPVEVDSRAVVFMDSMAIAAIARLSGAGVPVRFIDPPELVRFLLEVTHVGAEVEIDDDDPLAATGAPSTTV